MNRIKLICLSLALAILASCKNNIKPGEDESIYAGSGTCIECHPKFYELWSTSHHGKAMQRLDSAFIAEAKLPDSETFAIEDKEYRTVFSDSSMKLIENNSGVINEFKALWVLGGKNVYYFLTMLDKGKLQTLPLAWDLNLKKWYNNPQSALRHFPEGPAEMALPWMDRMYNFNTSCYSCHVSQLQTNFDLATDSYQSEWKEAGINCETCHGPSGDHVRIYKKAKGKTPPKESGLGLISTKSFTKDQHNWSCAPCHAKMRPLTASYMPGEPYFDNYDLVILNNPDFYPDGRDLGENYTYTGWLMNECTQKGELHCVTCHTSSGRDRFRDNPNDACKSCHPGKAENVTLHSQHKAGSKGAICINCHMPKSEFGKMRRSDHSFRPPMPEATIKFGSPNACNMCHTDKSASWANSVVKKRRNPDYQDLTIAWAELMRKARQGEWSELDSILAIIDREELNEVVVASFIRTLQNCESEKKWQVLIGAIDSKSPITRAAAAAGLKGNSSIEARDALLHACSDEFRLVRIEAANSLAAFNNEMLTTSPDTAALSKATGEYLAAMLARPDDWSSHYNLGLYQQNRGDYQLALASYENAARLYPESLLPLINSSVLYSQTGNSGQAEQNLRKVLAIDPANEAANLNYGLLLAEQNRITEAETALKKVLETNKNQAVAAYNLSVITAPRNLDEAVKYASIAAGARPEEPKYAYTVAFYMLRNNQKTEAVRTLRSLLAQHPSYLDAYSLLAEFYALDGKIDEAIRVYQQALRTDGISGEDKTKIRNAVSELQKSL